MVRVACRNMVRSHVTPLAKVVVLQRVRECVRSKRRKAGAARSVDMQRCNTGMARGRVHAPAAAVYGSNGRAAAAARSRGERRHPES